MIKVEKLIYLRVLTLFLGFGSSMYISTYLIQEFGSQNFVFFATISALPMFLPFADLGLGVSWINNIVSKEKDDNQTIRRYSESYFTILLYLFALVCLINYGLVEINFWDLIFPNSGINNINLYCSLIITGTFLAAPFALSFKKLQYEGKMSLTLLIQGAIPVISAGLITFSVNLKLPFGSILLIPIMSYLVTTYFAFIISGMSKYARLIDLYKALGIAKGSFLTGAWSVLLTVLTVLVFQVPRLMLLNRNQADIALSYSFALMLFLPAMSLFGVLASTRNVQYLRTKGDLAFGIFRRIQFRALLQPVIFVSLGATFVGSVVEPLSLKFLDLSKILTTIPVLILCCLAQFVLVIQTRELEIRRNALYLGLILVFENIAIFFDFAKSFNHLILLILLPTWLFLTATVWFQLGRSKIPESSN